MRARWAMAVIFVGLLGVTYLRLQPRAVGVHAGGRRRLLVSIVQAPPGASLEYGRCGQGGGKDPAGHAGSRIGVLAAGLQLHRRGSEPGIVFTLLKPFDEREQRDQRIQALLPRLRGPLFSIQGGLVVPFAPPGINIGNVGGFSMEVLDQGGGARNVEALGNAVFALVGASQAQPASPESSASSPPTIRSWRSTSIARRRAASGCRSARSRAMQIYLGSA